MLHLRSGEEVASWLDDKPHDWARVIAMRAALRVMPIAQSVRTSLETYSGSERVALKIVQANLRNWIILREPSIFDRLNGDNRVFSDIFVTSFMSLGTYPPPKSSMWPPRASMPAMESEPLAEQAGDAAAAATALSLSVVLGERFQPVVLLAASADILANALNAAAKSLGLIGKSIHLASRGRQWSDLTVEDPYGHPVGDEATVISDKSAELVEGFWKAVSSDASTLEANDWSREVVSLAASPLWPEGSDLSDGVLAEHIYDGRWLERPNFSVLRDWFRRRLTGERRAFDIPGDERREEDRAVLERLLLAETENFWSEGAAHVNDELRHWLDEARERAGQDRAGPDEEELIAKLPPQNPNAIQFKRSESGKIEIAALRRSEELRTDVEARDRYGATFSLAHELRGNCQGNNAAERLVRFLESYISAVGEGIERVRPSLLVLAGERLRKELASYESADSTLPPLKDDLIADLSSLVKAHNLFVRLDPALRSLDEATLGPRTEPSKISVEEAIQLAREADAAGLLADGVAEVLVEAADVVPKNTDGATRQFRFCVESYKNLAIELFALALNHPAKTSAAGLALYAMLPASIGAAMGQVLVAGAFLLSKREWFEARLGRHAPEWARLVSDLFNYLERHTPFGSNSH